MNGSPNILGWIARLNRSHVLGFHEQQALQTSNDQGIQCKEASPTKHCITNMQVAGAHSLALGSQKLYL